MAPPATTPVNTVDNTDNITPWNTSHATLPAFALDIGRRVKRNHNQRSLCETGTGLDHNRTIVISENHLLRHLFNTIPKGKWDPCRPFEVKASDPIPAAEPSAWLLGLGLGSQTFD